MRDTVRFLLNRQVEEIRDCGPTDTLLEFLRERRRLTGTKEGCAEGDCGACTVVVAEPAGDRLCYRAVNSCILFLPAVDGRQVITVEGLTEPGGALHPVQRAMVDMHGSQCGFCTPGFVMSLFALFHDAAGHAPTRGEIDAALAGNLCRCTGYLPIVRAARQALEPGRSDRFTEAEQEVLGQLRKLSSEEALRVERGGRRYLAPTSLSALCALREEWPEATLVAGATDAGLWVTKQMREIDTVISTSRVTELRRIVRDEDAGQLEIGAAATYSEAMPLLLGAWPGFTEVLSRLGGTQVRNAGTIGGNIANGSPIGDMPPGLIALDARLVLASSAGERIIALEDFFLAYGRQDLRPGECLARILVPLPAPRQVFRTYKLSRRTEQDISAVCAAFRLELDDGIIAGARIAFGGMAGIPMRAGHCENALAGRPWNEKTVASAMRAMQEDFQPITDLRASAGYRMRAAQNLLRRFYLEHSGAGYPVRLENSRGAEEARA